jgi:4-nitrophenyl phosphatase
MATRLSDSAGYASLLGKYDTWMFDCDGVLWQGDRIIEGAVDVLNILRAMSMLSLTRSNFYRLLVL